MLISATSISIAGCVGTRNGAPPLSRVLPPVNQVVSPVPAAPPALRLGDDLRIAHAQVTAALMACRVDLRASAVRYGEVLRTMLQAK